MKKNRKYYIDPKKVFDKNPAVAIRNLTMLIEATGVQYTENNPFFEKIKHLLKK